MVSFCVSCVIVLRGWLLVLVFMFCFSVWWLLLCRCIVMVFVVIRLVIGRCGLMMIWLVDELLVVFCLRLKW